jgi:hypothetical protein
MQHPQGVNMFTRPDSFRHARADLAVATLTPTHLANAGGESKSKLTPATEIEERVRRARPLLGGKIPSAIGRGRLGATEVDHPIVRRCGLATPAFVEYSGLRHNQARRTADPVRDETLLL